MDYEEKYVLAQSKVESISSENASFTGQVTKLITNLVKAQDCLSVLEKDLKTEKAFCALTDKQLEVALGRVHGRVRRTWMSTKTRVVLFMWKVLTSFILM